MKIAGHEIDISNPEKKIFPDITKQDIIEYYASIAGCMFPHLKGRPLSLERYPDGVDGQIFYQKKVPPYFPEWIGKREIKTEEGKQGQIALRSIAGIIYLANQVCTPHIWLSKGKHLDKPDRMIFDLDPSDLNSAVAAAKQLRKVIKSRSLEPFLMLTGGRGMHIVVPIYPEKTFDDTRKIALEMAKIVVEKDPDSFTLEQRKEKRRGRVFIDIQRNAYGQTVVAPYAIRAKDGAPVAMPIHWKELGTAPDHYDIVSAKRRLAQTGDIWKHIDKARKSLKS